MSTKTEWTAKVGLAALASAISAALGWKGIMAAAWVIAMALDYLSGTMAACKAGQWSSTIAREGLWHKGGMLLVVVVAGIADIILSVICEQVPEMGITWSGAVLPLVLAWSILTELGSILENAAKLGASIPQWLLKLLKASAKAAETAGDKLNTAE